MRDTIGVKGARENNLKNIDVEIPREKLVVLTGLSGSGKSSLAFETIYAEGQRRFLESLSTYSRKYVAQLKKPDVDFVYGLSPVISIEQKSISKNPRSTVGTMTDIFDYLRGLYAISGTAHCPYCRREVPVRSVAQIAEHVLSLPAGTLVEIDAPVLKIFDCCVATISRNCQLWIWRVKMISCSRIDSVPVMASSSMICFLCSYSKTPTSSRRQASV